MIQIDLAPSDPIVRLAALIGPVLFGEEIKQQQYFEGLLDFAIKRHRVGPLLHIASREQTRWNGASKEQLREHWEANARQHAFSSLNSKRVARIFASASIPSLLVKGTPLAKMLYRDPLLRHSGDIDILVPLQAVQIAAQQLKTRGIACTDPVLSLPDPIRKVALAIIRDISFDDRATGQHFELHSRLYFSKRMSKLSTSLDGDLRPLFLPEMGDLPTPPLGPSLALYLLHHGAVSGWSRLKWLVDIVPLMAQLGPNRRSMVAAYSERAGTSAAVKASLVLLQIVFPNVQLSPLEDWLNERSGAASVRRRTISYLSWLNNASESAAKPLDSRREGLKSTLLMNDLLSHQVALLAPAAASSAIRILAATLFQ